MSLLEHLKMLVKAPGVTGGEQEVSSVIKTLFKNYSDDVWQDRNGNVFCRVGDKTEPEVMIMAHMDEVGLMVTDIEENGMLHFINVGGVDSRVLPGSEVLIIGKEKVKGVVGAIPPHLTKGQTDKAYKMDDLLIDTGLSAETVKKLINVGDYITYAPKEIVELANGNITSKTLDDRALIGMMLRCLEILKGRKLKCSVVFCASVQEEVTCLGAATAANSVHPDMAVVVDVCHARTPGTKPYETFPLDKVVITKGSNIHPKLVKMIEESAEDQNIPVEYEFTMKETYTDAWDIQTQIGGIPCAIVSPPLKYMHTSVEVINLNTLENIAKILVGFLGSIDENWEDKLCLDN